MTQHGRCVVESDLLTVAEAAKWLRLGKQTVYQAVYANRLPYCRYGSRILFPVARLQEWVLQNTVEPKLPVKLRFNGKSIRLISKKAGK
jgi:excisionase family DNA binding protein